MAISYKGSYSMEIVQCARNIDSSFHVIELGWSTPPAGLNYHRCDPEFTVHFVASGRGLFNGMEVDASKGFLIAANEQYEYRLDEDEPWEHYWFRFGGDSAAQVLGSLGMRPVSQVFECDWLEALRPEFDRLLRSEMKEVDISVYLLGLFYKTMSYYSASRPQTSETRSESYLRLARQFAERNYAEPITVEDMAKAASVSSKYLYKLFTERRGESPKSYLMALRLERARVLLERTNLTITEVARSVGYEHPSYFTASFRRVYTLTPAEYRREKLTKNNLSKEPVMTDNRLALASAIYSNYYGNPLSEGRLAELIERVHRRLPELNEIDEFSDLPWNHEHGRELWYTALCGLYDGFPGGRLGAERGLVDAEKVATLELITPDCGKLAEILEKAESRLAKAAALYLYKNARLALFSPDFSAVVKLELAMLTEKVKASRRDFGAETAVTGSPEFERDYIYKSERGPFVREVRVRSKQPGTPPLEIVQLTDLHYNYCSPADLAEANPSLMSTLEHRKWLADGASVKPVRRALDYADMSDLTVVTGDILDYLSKGAAELTVRELFRRDVTMLASVGGHDITRKMHGKIPDESSLESRYDILRSFWLHDVRYESRIVGGKAIVIVIDNGLGGYDDEQRANLELDLALAREQKLVALIFQHEQLSTANPADIDVPYIRAGDTSGGFDFSPKGSFIGSQSKRDGATAAVYELVRSYGDVIGGIFCGHHHNDMYTEILTSDGGVIPQYILTACPYDGAGHVIRITVE